MARPNRLAGGRPTDEEAGRVQPEVEHEGLVLHPTARYWVEGEIVVPDWDIELHEEMTRVAGILKNLDPRDETGTKLPGVLVLRYQDLPEDPRFNSGLRRYTRRSHRRLCRADLLSIIKARPGRTVYHLADELVLAEHGREPTDAERAATVGKLRVLLHKLMRDEVVVSRPVPSSKKVAYYPANPDPPKASEAAELFRGLFGPRLHALGAPAAELDLLFQQIDEVLKFNERRLLGLWRDPRGNVLPSPPFDKRPKLPPMPGSKDYEPDVPW